MHTKFKNYLVSAAIIRLIYSFVRPVTMIITINTRNSRRIISLSSALCML